MVEHKKSRRERRLKFHSGGNLRGFPRGVNFVRVRAAYNRVHFILLSPFFRVRRLLVRVAFRVRARYKRAFKRPVYTKRERESELKLR